MAKDRSEKKEKKEKKDKKRSETDGVHKKSKKDKKDTTKLAEVAEKELPSESLERVEAPKKATDTHTEEIESAPTTDRPAGAVVPFANPLADEKATKKLLKGVKKGMHVNSAASLSQNHFLFSNGSKLSNRKNYNLTYIGWIAAANKSLKRGVKEVVKALRKSPVQPANVAVTSPTGIVVLAADISPMDVISHIPVLCEDHGIPYVYVTSRAELGSAGATKRPTSVVMITPRASGKKQKDSSKGGAEDKEEFSKTYDELVKALEKETKKVKV